MRIGCCVAQFDGNADALSKSMLEAFELYYLFQDREILINFSISIVRTVHSFDWSLLLRTEATAMHRLQGQGLNTSYPAKVKFWPRAR